MKELINENDQKALDELCISVKELVYQGNYPDCERLISIAMGKYPHAPEPHNLFGLLLEKFGDHPNAMKHFRAAWALDPTYLPARQNLDCYGTFSAYGHGIYEKSDCQVEKTNKYIIEYDERGIGHMKRKV